MKSFTDIEQSKKLAEILPIESADMYYQYVLPKSDKIRYNPEIGNPTNTLKWYNEGYVFSGKEPITMDEFCVPCWSLGSLLDILPEGTKLLKSSNISSVSDIKYFCDCPKYNVDKWFDNPINACYEVILKLKEYDTISKI